MLVVCLLSTIFFPLGLSAEVQLCLATSCTLREIEEVVGVKTDSLWGWGKKKSVLFVSSGDKEVDSGCLLDDHGVELEEGNVGGNVDVSRELMAVIVDATPLAMSRSLEATC